MLLSLDGGADDLAEVLAPARARRQARVLEPLGQADERSQPLELVLASDLGDEPAIGGAERIADERDTRPLAFAE